MISAELALLHKLVLAELKNIAKFGDNTILILQGVREEIYKLTGFPLVTPHHDNQKIARQILEGPRYRMLSRASTTEAFNASWLNVSYAGQLYDNGMMDVQFGDLVLEKGEIRPMTSMDRELISEAANEYSASK